MFTHLLLPTDGSKLSEATIQKGIEFAKNINAKVTGFCVIPELHFFSYETEIPADVKQRVARESRALAEKHLAVVATAARKAGVTCDTVHVTSDPPYEAIVKAAAEKGLRSHHDGIPRPQRREGPAARQRNTKSVNSFQDPRAGVPLSGL